ncbi:MAG: MerR family transcriptional regulator [Salinisphaeraceae bacterium]|nr:MerR family transcriptional regulator [Salinisphaeraceae bacterium]
MAELGENLMTIEELSFRSGVTTRNIRAYQSRGLLLPPETQAGTRAAFYHADHLARLKLIDRLQQRGFSLAGIADLLDAWESGHSLEQVLGMEAAVAEDTPDNSQLVEEETLKAMIPPDMDEKDLLARLRGLGLISREGRQYRVRDPQLLALGIDAHAAGIPFDKLVEEFENLQADAHAIARRFVAMYNEHIWLPYMEAGMPSDQLGDMIDRMKRLRRLAVGIAEPLMSQAMADEIDSIAQTNLPDPDEVEQDRAD